MPRKFWKVKTPSQSRSLNITGVNPTVEVQDSCQSSVLVLEFGTFFFFLEEQREFSL